MGASSDIRHEGSICDVLLLFPVHRWIRLYGMYIHKYAPMQANVGLQAVNFWHHFLPLIKTWIGKVARKAIGRGVRIYVQEKTEARIRKGIVDYLMGVLCFPSSHLNGFLLLTRTCSSLYSRSLTWWNGEQHLHGLNRGPWSLTFNLESINHRIHTPKCSKSSRR